MCMCGALVVTSAPSHLQLDTPFCRRPSRNRRDAQVGTVATAPRGYDRARARPSRRRAGVASGPAFSWCRRSGATAPVAFLAVLATQPVGITWCRHTGANAHAALSAVRRLLTQSDVLHVGRRTGVAAHHGVGQVSALHVGPPTASVPLALALHHTCVPVLVVHDCVSDGAHSGALLPRATSVVSGYGWTRGRGRACPGLQHRPPACPLPLLPIAGSGWAVNSVLRQRAAPAHRPCATPARIARVCTLDARDSGTRPQ